MKKIMEMKQRVMLAVFALLLTNYVSGQRDTSYVIFTEIDLVKTQEHGLIIHTRYKEFRSPEQVFIWRNGIYEKLDCVSVKYYIVTDDGEIHKSNLYKSN